MLDPGRTSRRAFLAKAVGALAVAAALPLAAEPTATFACAIDPQQPTSEPCRPATPLRPAGDPSFQPWWVSTFLPTKTWPTPHELAKALGETPVDRIFKVEGPQQGLRLPVWDPRKDEHVFVGVEAVGPVETPFWAAFADNGRWLDVNLTPMQHLKAMQGDEEVLNDLVTAGLQGTTKPGFYRILRRVYNETMDSRTIPNSTDTYLLKDVLYTQYFTGDGAAIHYNYWGPPRGFGYPGSHGCLGMRMAGSKFLWDWAGVGTPLVIHY
ncbi:MAG: L,D-transpeptidase [Chloroflexota bacterium]